MRPGEGTHQDLKSAQCVSSAGVDAGG